MSSDQIDKTKQQIRALVGEVSQISKSDVGPEEYYPAFLGRVVQALAAPGGAIWLSGESQAPQVSYQINVSDTLMEDDNEDGVRHKRLIGQIMAGTEGQLIPPQSGTSEDGSAGNPTNFLLVLAPIIVDGQCEGVIEIFQRADAAPAAQRGYLRFLLNMRDQFAEWCKSRKLKQFGDRHQLWELSDKFSRQVHSSLDLSETCYTIANEGQQLIKCDRVTVAIKQGPRCKIRAVSGQAKIENRSNVVRYLSELASKVCATGEPLWYEGSTEDLPPQIEKTIDAYVDESYSKVIAILPIRRPKSADERDADNARGEATLEDNQANEIIGALICEQIERDEPREMLQKRIGLVYEHSARAVSNSLSHNELFLMPVWRTLGKLSVVTKARNLPKTLAVAGALVLLLGVLFFMQTDFRVKAEGSLQPIWRQDVFVEVPGTIIDVHVEDQQDVDEGQPLVTLRNPEQHRLYEDLVGNHKAANASAQGIRRRLNLEAGRLNDPEIAELRTQLNELDAQIDSFDRQMKQMEENLDRLVVKSPRKGKVLLSWSVEKSLMGRVVEPGQVLMTVADPNGPWELDLFMLEKRVGYVNAARRDPDLGEKLKVDYYLATAPGEGFEGWVKAVDPVTRLDGESGHGVRIQVEFEMDNHPHPRVGSRVTAKVHCGRASVGFTWFHEAIEWVQGMLF